MRKNSILKLTTSSILIALGIVIPMFSPVKILLEPASFTLASHVPIFIAMFISPSVAIAVAIGTTLGFFFSGFPVVVVLRAASHIIFATLGANYLQKIDKNQLNSNQLRIFSLIIALIHSFCEVLVVSGFYFSGSISSIHLEQGFTYSVLLLVGVGTIIHSVVDFEITQLLLIPLKKQRIFASFFNEHN